jgi:hypothetical protein
MGGWIIAMGWCMGLLMGVIIDTRVREYDESDDIGLGPQILSLTKHFVLFA